VTARAYATSEPDLEAGAGTGLFWVLVLLIAAGLAIAGWFIGGRFRCRWSWTDAAVAILMVLVASSALHALDRRPAINLAWEWIALGVAYLLLRSLPRTRRESSALAGALVATAVAVAAYGLYQGSVEMPMLRAEYRRNPQQFLIQHHLNLAPGSREHFLWEQRFLQSNEVMSTFALGNSLAGFLVGPLVLALAVGFQNLVRRDGDGSRWKALGMAAPLILILSICLMFTKSRSAWIGLLVGVGIVAWQWRRAVPARVLLGTGLGGLALVIVLALGGLATGWLDREVLTQSRMSLGYRWEYWQGTWRILTGGASDPWAAVSSPTFWSGVGPGNFRGPYLRSKLPQSSEEILDPHNLFLEVWATAGFWALAALVAALALGLWNLLGPPSRPGAGTDAEPARGRASRKSQASATAEPVARPGEEDEADAPPCRPFWLVASAGAGWILVIVLGQMNLFEEGSFSRWLILGGSWLGAAWLGRPLWRRLPIPASALGAAVAAVAINLLAAGGIGIPTVALGLWSLLALGLNLREDRPCSRLREFESRVPSFSLAAGWAAVLGVFLGAAVPFWRTEAAIAEAEEALQRRPPEFEGAERAYRRAIAAEGFLAVDRYSARPWLGYAQSELAAWRWRGARVGDERWKKVLVLLRDAVTPPRNPNSWPLHMRLAETIRALLQHLGSKLTPLEVVQLGGEIVKETRMATLLYPSNAGLHARLAEASAEISMFGDAAKEAEEALRLDRLTPHPDKKLPEDVRRRLESRLPEWREKAPQGLRLDRTP
jgi:O-antigen ligase